MPVTATWVPVLSQFLCAVEKNTGMQAPPVVPSNVNEDARASTVKSDDTGAPAPQKPLPKGVVIGKDGKPCRSCTSASAWIAMAKGKPSPKASSTNTSHDSTTTATTNTTLSPPSVASDVSTLSSTCPPDVEALGRSAWTLLHTMTATYPSTPTPAIQQQTKSFISSFSNLYPCGHCAEDFRQWMKVDGNAPRLGSRRDFGEWMCEAHNAVNEKLGKKKFDCFKWEERWRTGPADGSCG